jgi:hypothetical protein
MFVIACRSTINHAAQKRGAANRMRVVARAADLAPAIAQIRANGATTLAAIAEGLNAASIPTCGSDMDRLASTDALVRHSARINADNSAQHQRGALGHVETNGSF